MQWRRIIAGGVLSMVFATMGLALTACGSSNSESVATSNNGESVYEEKCSTCHSLDTVKNSTHSGEADWTAVVNDMVDNNGASLTDEEKTTVVAYLVSTD